MTIKYIIKSSKTSSKLPTRTTMFMQDMVNQQNIVNKNNFKTKLQIDFQ